MIKYSMMESRTKVEIKEDNSETGKLARIIYQSFRLSQGVPIVQQVILLLIGKKLKMSDGFKSGKLDVEVVDKVKGILSGSKNLAEPIKLSAAGLHSNNFGTETIQNYCSALRGVLVYKGEVGWYDGLFTEEYVIDREKLVFEMIKKDYYYLCELTDGFGSVVGRPGSNKTRSPEQYDDYSFDKFFSYVVVFLIKKKPYPDDVDGVLTEVLRELAEMSKLKDTIGKLNNLQNEDIDMFASRLSDVVNSYNTHHGTGQVLI